MTALKIHWFKWVVIFMVASFVMGGLFKLTYHLDSDKQVVEDFLRESPYLEFSIGELQKMRISRVTNFHGTEAKPAYKDYLYHLKGSKRSAMVKVRHHYDCKFKPNECTSILSIE